MTSPGESNDPALRGGGGRLPGVTLLLALGALVVYAAPSLTHWLEYDRAALASGQLWRLVTCHLTHWTLDHLAWDVLAFVGLGALCERDGRHRLIACLVASAVAVSLVVWATEPALDTYRGLSGLDSALFTLLAARVIAEGVAGRRWGVTGAGCLALVGLLTKVSWEVLTRSAVFAGGAGVFVPVPSAHLVGAGVGLLTAVLVARAPVSELPVLPLLRKACLPGGG